MNIVSTRTIIGLVVFLTLVVGGIFLQIFLSKKKSKWPGLILPGITLLYSLIMILGFAVFQGMTTQEISTQGEVTTQSITTQIGTAQGMTNTQILIQVIITFLITNIPTYILLGIYFGCREKLPKNSPIDKMNIQDLE